MDIVAPSNSTPPPNIRRTSSQYFTPPSASPIASASSKVSAAVNFFETRSREGSPLLEPRPGPSRRPSESSQVDGLEEVLSDGVTGNGGSSGRRRGGVSSDEGSPTPVKAAGGRVTAETTPTRPAPRSSMSASRIPLSSSSASPSRLAPRSSPSVAAGSIPPPRSVSYGQAGPSRIPRPVRRIPSSTSTASSTSHSRPSTPTRESPASQPRSRIPVLTPRRRARELSDTMASRVKPQSGTDLQSATSAEAPSHITSPTDPHTPPVGSRRTSYLLSQSTTSPSISPSPSRAHARRPSSGSLGSPGRRPSGPRMPNNPNRSSISSLSSLQSDGDKRTLEEGLRGSISGRSSAQSISELDEKVSAPPPTSPPVLPNGAAPATPARAIHIDIPPRTTSANGGSPLLTARPPLTPRLSSRDVIGDRIAIASPKGGPSNGLVPAAEYFPPDFPVAPPARPPIDAKRRASNAVVLGEVATSPRNPRPHSAYPVQRENSDFMPGPSTSQKPNIAGRRASQVSYGTVPLTEASSPTLYSPEKSERSATLPRQSPRTEKNRQGLVVDTSGATRVVTADPSRRQSSAQPSPPIPVKNPMRQRSRPESAASTRRIVSESGNGDSPITRTPSVYLDSPAEETDEGASPSGREWGKMPVSAGAKDDRYSTDSRRSRRGDRVKSGTDEAGWAGKRRGRIMGPDEMEALMQAADREVAQRVEAASSAKGSPDKAGAPDPIVALTTTTTAPTPSPVSTPTLEEGPPEHHTPEPSRHHPPTKSPSLPMLGHGSPPSKASRLLGLSPGIQSQMRSGTDPMAAQNRLLPPPMLRSPTSPNIITTNGTGAVAANGARPPSAVLSKRSHLIREIAMTERAYANDLALLRDAFIGRAAQRRPSTNSIAESFTAGGVSPGGNPARGVLTASQSMDNRRTSEYSNHSTLGSVPPPASPLPKSPSAAEGVGMSSFFGSSASLSPLPQFSPRTSTIGMAMAAPIGKPISPPDMRAIFLNIDQLASASEDLATEFEKAIGEEATGPGVTARDGEAGTDKLGEAFMTHLPRIRPLYTFYCARQSTASVRLVEIQADATHSTYLKDRWNQIKPHTHAWNLDSMLIKPVQRITKYPLLFDDLLACTTPVHPDYFSIRSAAEQCRTMALEIDEAKRRKDLVAGVISNKPSTGTGAVPGSKEAKTPSRKVGGGLKLFRNKDKSGSGSTISLSNTLASSSSISLAPAVSNSTYASTATLVPSSPSDMLGGLITPASFSDYRLLVEKLDEAERTVRRVGREIVVYTAAAKEVFVAQMALTTGWERVVRLDGTDPGDKRLRAFKQVGEGLIESGWVELNYEVVNQIMPALTKLLDCSANPRKVILKRDAKLADYTRIAQQKDRQRVPVRAALDSAREFVGLHTQLLEELPPFLDGYIRIFDMTVAAFARAQAGYHSLVSEKVEAYMNKWITASAKRNPRSPTSVHSRNTIDLNDDLDVPSSDLSGAQAIIEKWETAWAPYSQAMDHLRITRPAATRTMADRMADYSDRTGARGHVRTPSNRSGGASPTGSLSRSGSGSGNRPASTHSNRRSGIDGGSFVSPSGSIRRSGTNQDGGRSRASSLLQPATEGFKVYRTSTSGPSGSGSGAPTDKSDAASLESRLSFGLPRIPRSEEQSFVDLSFASRSRASSGAGVDALGLGSPSTPIGPGPGMGSVAVVPPTPPTQGGSRVVSNADSMTRRGAVQEDDAGEGWRNERVLYQCAVVADFEPTEIGTRRYRKLRFLPLLNGDLIDVFYEVGRIDELPAFPYPEIGVENDGLLVGRKEDGDIGLVICSFLEPIT